MRCSQQYAIRIARCGKDASLPALASGTGSTNLPLRPDTPLMFEKHPSLLGFQPHFYIGGPERFHLPFAYDLVATGRPKMVVTLGFGDGEVHFAFCQAARENRLPCRLLVVRTPGSGEQQDDNAWQAGLDYNGEFYSDLSTFFAGSPEAAAAGVAEASVDLLFLNDCDSYVAARRQLDAWAAKISPAGIILVHGIGTKRERGIAQFWTETRTETSVEFSAGAGLGVTSAGQAAPSVLTQLIGRTDHGSEIEPLYLLAAERIAAQARAEKISGENRMLQLRQVWLPTLLADRIQMQDTIDHLNRHIAHVAGVHEWNEAQLQQQLNSLRAASLLESEAAIKKLRDKCGELKARVDELTRKLDHAASRRSLPQRIAREIQRIPRNLRRLWKTDVVKKKESEPRPREHVPAEVAKGPPPVERYERWISEHEPDEAALLKQRQGGTDFARGPKISLLVPVHDTPVEFLEAMFASVRQQTYPQWELCLVDAGSTRAETIEALKGWNEPRLRFERLERNLGISENTNRALALATGEFIALLDHDDLLAPFALHEFARAIEQFPAADIFYSDEDRIDENGRRHSPFFKPEWSPELLYSCMYIGHLTAYRRTLIESLGGFRKEFDLSQDYDLALRATERARAIRHIPQVLYHWREHPASGSIGGKPEARKTNLAALDDAMRRRNLPAEVIEYSTANRARLKVSRWPRVSIVIPTDSPERAADCAVRLPGTSSYPDFEIILVTNGRIGNVLARNADRSASVRVVRYDKPFNFSDKCNVGAAAATGERIIFLNDDIEPQQRDWIENLIEPLENAEVGAVSPKLLYPAGTIQHAGLVTGVRGFVGTAFHQLPGDSTIHVNFIQSMRNVSAVSGACMAMRRSDFVRARGFDAERLPIFHSDVDLCFKVRDAGMRCVYTPFAVMTHRGHASLGAVSEPARFTKDKSDLYLLRRWGGYIAHDPYFPENMRDWLYTDSPAPIQMYGRNRSNPEKWISDALLVSSDLGGNGASVLLRLAVWCSENGIFPLVIAAEDGPLRSKYEEAGISVLIDPLLCGNEALCRKFSRNFDCLIANTPEDQPAVRAGREENVPVLCFPREFEMDDLHFATLTAKIIAAVRICATKSATA